jgi:hypothetical protein
MKVNYLEKNNGYGIKIFFPNEKKKSLKVKKNSSYFYSSLYLSTEYVADFRRLYVYISSVNLVIVLRGARWVFAGTEVLVLGSSPVSMRFCSRSQRALLGRRMFFLKKSLIEEVSGPHSFGIINLIY